MAGGGDREAVPKRPTARGRGAEHREEDLDTARLVTRIQAGDREAFGDLYTRYFDRIYAYLRVALGGDIHEAEDAAQQIFLNVLEALPAYERRGGPFRVWLFAVARNYAITQIKKRSRLELVEPAEMDRLREPEAAHEPELEVLGWLNDEELIMFIERLDEVPRQVLSMRFMLDLTPVQIGKVLGRTPNDVSVIQRRALLHLRERLKAIGRGPKQPADPARMGAWNPQDPVLRNRRFALM